MRLLLILSVRTRASVRTSPPGYAPPWLATCLPSLRCWRESAMPLLALLTLRHSTPQLRTAAVHELAELVADEVGAVKAAAIAAAAALLPTLTAGPAAARKVCV